MSFLSPIESIRNLRFSKFPKGAVKCLRAISVGSDIFVLGADDIIYNDRHATHCWTFTSDVAWQKRILMALVKLGVVDKRDADQHCKLSADAVAKMNRESALQELSACAMRAGIELTKAQLKVCSKTKKK